MPPSPATQGQVYTPPAPTPRELIGCYRGIADLRGADLLTFASLTAPVVRELFAMADALKAEFRRVRGEDKETGEKETRRGEQGKRAKTQTTAPAVGAGRRSWTALAARTWPPGRKASRAAPISTAATRNSRSQIVASMFYDDRSGGVHFDNPVVTGGT